MPSQKGLISPLLIFGVIVILLAAGALYYYGFFNAPGSSTSAPEPESSTPAPLVSATPSQTPMPSDYSNPFTEDDTYENPFNTL